MERTQRGTGRRWLGTIASIAVALAMAGCNDSAKSSGKLDSAVAAYDLGKYEQAHGDAVAALATTQGAKREEAAYVAGMSAYQMRDDDEAERRFMTAAASKDSVVAGRSKAGLGLVRLRQQRPAAAAIYFRDAAAVLPDDEAAQANRIATILGGNASAAGTVGTGSNVSAGTRTPTDPNRPWTTSTTGFAIQVGAFSSMANARDAATTAQGLADGQGLGAVRVHTRSEGGRPLYVVQFGRFNARSQAESALTRLGRTSYVVAPLLSTTG